MTADNEHSAFDELVLYFAGELAAGDETRVEEHLMGCASCTAASTEIVGLIEGLRSVVPITITSRDVARLQAAGTRLVENEFAPGERKEAFWTMDTDLLVHRLKVDLRDVDVVSLEAKDEAGKSFFRFADVLADKRDGAVLIACQQHLVAICPEPDTVFVLRDGTERVLGEYTVLHRFR